MVILYVLYCNFVNKEQIDGIDAVCVGSSAACNAYYHYTPQ